MTDIDRSAGILVAVNSRGERWGYQQIAVYLAGQSRPASVATLMSYKSKGVLPEPDATHPAAPDRPLWWSMTIMAWDSARPGQGSPGQKRAPRKRTTTTGGETTNEQG